MKMVHRLIVAVFIMVLSIPAIAQKKTVVGKWKIVSLDAEGISINLEKPEESKLIFAAQIEKESGSKPDSAMVENAYSSLSTMFATMQLEFTTTGKGIYSVPLPGGDVKKDTATYTVDYTKGILNTTTIEEGKKKTDNIKIKFEGDYLIMINDEKKETIKVKRSK
jgi:hypothetical protein